MHYCNIKQLSNITKLEWPKDIKSWRNKIFLPVLGQAWLFNSQYTKNNTNVIFPLGFQRDCKQYFLLGIQSRGKDLFLLLPEFGLSLPWTGREFLFESQKSPTKQIPKKVTHQVCQSRSGAVAAVRQEHVTSTELKESRC